VMPRTGQAREAWTIGNVVRRLNFESFRLAAKGEDSRKDISCIKSLFWASEGKRDLCVHSQRPDHHTITCELGCRALAASSTHTRFLPSGRGNFTRERQVQLYRRSLRRSVTQTPTPRTPLSKRTSCRTDACATTAVETATGHRIAVTVDARARRMAGAADASTRSTATPRAATTASGSGKSGTRAAETGGTAATVTGTEAPRVEMRGETMMTGDETDEATATSSMIAVGTAITMTAAIGASGAAGTKGATATT
jgi:hypothetical protein